MVFKAPLSLPLISRFKPLAAGLLLAISSGAIAAASPTGVSAEASGELAEMSLQQLMELEVFTAASLIPTQTVKAPGTVYSFSQQDFKRYGVRRLDDLLQYVPGIQVNQYRKRHRSIWARGLLQRYNNKMVLLIDGVRQQHLYYGHFSLGDDLPLERIEKVEIILGAASSLYGANAFSGLISITTRDFTEQPSWSLTVEAGSSERAKITGFYSDETVQAFASYLDQEAPFDENRRTFIGGQSLQPLDEDYQSLHLKVRPTDELTLMVDYRKQETPFVFIPATQDAFVEGEFLSLAANYRVGNMDDGMLEISGYYQLDKGREHEIEQVTQTLGYEERQDANLGGLSATAFKRYGAHALVAGASFTHEDAEDTRFLRRFIFSSGFLPTPETGDLLSVPGIENNDYALFAQDVWTLDKHWEVTLDVRYDDFEQFGDYFNYRAAVVYTPSDDQVFKVLYGTAIRTPSHREYLKVLEGTSFEPPVPDAERLKSFELGYDFVRDRWNLHLAAYYNDYEDSIQERPTPDAADEFFINEDDGLSAKGMEMQLAYRRESRWELVASLAYVDVSSDEFDRLHYIASWSGSVMAGYHWRPKHRVGLSLVYNNERDDFNDFSDDEAEAFVLTNFYGSGQLTSSLSYEFGIDNLFDEEIFDPAADFGGQYNNERARRTAWLKLQWSHQ